MFNNRHDLLIKELKTQRDLAMQKLDKVHLVKNEKLAEYYFCKFQEGQDVPYSLLKNIPVGEALLLPVVFGGAIVTTREIPSKSDEIIYNTKWTPGSTLTMHYHSDCNEIMLVTKGTIKVFVQGTTRELNAGETIEIASGIMHQATALKESEVKITFKKVQW